MTFWTLRHVIPVKWSIVAVRRHAAARSRSRRSSSRTWASSRTSEGATDGDFSETDLLGTDFRFLVEVDGYSLGSWNSCKGLGITFKHEKVAELGQHAYNTFIPGRAEYTPITLQRAMTVRRLGQDQDVARVRDLDDGWLTPAADTKRGDDHDAGRHRVKRVAKWTLQERDAVSRGRGRSSTPTGKGVALETLEIVHEGFLDD